MAEARSRLGRGDEQTTRESLTEPPLRTLGFWVKCSRRSGSTESGPDYYLHGGGASGAEQPLAICLAYAWDRFLDGPDPERDPANPTENPGARVVSLLERSGATWAIVTNGKLLAAVFRRGSLTSHQLLRDRAGEGAALARSGPGNPLLLAVLPLPGLRAPGGGAPRRGA